MAVTATAVVLGWAVPVLAAAPNPPSSPATEDVESQTPVLAATVSDPDGGSVTGKFFARTPGSGTWNLVNGGSSAAVASGQRARLRLPVAQRIGASFEWVVQACDATVCSASSAVQTGMVSPMLGAGPRPNATRLSFDVGDRVRAQVDVGSGNLLVTTTEISLRSVQGSVDIGVAYNSRALGTAHEVGYPGIGWRMRVGADVRLVPNPDGSVTHVGADGLTGLFVLKSGSTTTYTAPVGFKADLVKTGTTGWTLSEHSTGLTSVFTASGLLDYMDDRNGQRTDFAYTGGGKLTQVVSSVGSTNQRTVNVGMDPGGRLSSLSQTGAGSSVQRQVAYNDVSSTGRLTSIVDVENRTTTFGYNTKNELTYVSNTGGAVTRFTYDSAHRVMSVKRENPAAGSPGDSITRLSYPSVSQTLVADPNTDQTQPVGSVPRTTYNLTAAGDLRVASAVDAGGHPRSRTYTPFADVATVSTPAGTSTFGHAPAVNGGESLTSTQAPMGAATSLAYANTGAVSKYLPSSTTNEQGRSSTYAYDGAGNQLSTTDATAAQAKVTYNPDGTVATATDPGNGTNSTSYSYNATTHQLTGVTPPTGTTLGGRSFSYDLFGRLGASTSGRGITTTYGYDKLDRLASVTYSDGTPPVTYTYDTAGRLRTRADTTGTTTWDYDPLNRLVSRTATSGGGALTYGYDKSSNLVRVTDGRGSTTYTYDTRNLPASMTTARGTVLRYAHNGDGKRIDTWFATNATNTVWAAHTHTDYDASNRVARTWTARNSNDATRSWDLSYCRSPYTGAACPTATASTDTALIQWATDNLTGARTTYTYDQADRLTGSATTVAGGKTYTYSYDARGNRLTAADGTSQSLTYNPGNQITTTGYTHDGAGNLTTAPSVGTLVYNGADQMVTATGSTTTGYRYAGTTQDELVHQDLPGTATIDYVYGRTDRQGLPIMQSVTKSGSGTVYLDHDPGGAPQVLTTDTGVEVFYVFDGTVGSPVGLVNTAGAVVGAYAYDPYGAYTTTTSTGSAAGINPYRTAAGIYDRGTGWIKYGQRWYNPTTGRFTQQDTIERFADPKQGNRYAYAADNPINYTDPTGQQGECLGGAFSSIAGVALIEGAELGLSILSAGGLSTGLSVGVGLLTGGLFVAGAGLIGLGLYLLAAECA